MIYKGIDESMFEVTERKNSSIVLAESLRGSRVCELTMDPTSQAVPSSGFYKLGTRRSDDFYRFGFSSGR